MALTECLECGKEISDQAISCPNCGNPMNGVQTIEATGKKYKAIQAVGFVLVLIGVLLFVVGPLGAAGVFFCIGLVILFYGRIGAWWHHE